MTRSAELAELEQYLDETRAELLRVVARIPTSRLCEPQTAGCWTGAQVVDHLRAVEASIVKVLKKLLREAPARDARIKMPDSRNLMHALDRFRIAERGRKVEAPEFVRPAPDPEPSQSLEALVQSRQELKRALQASETAMVDLATFPHALLGPLTFYQWVLFVGQHERRHAAQLCDMFGIPRVPASAG